MYSIFEKITFGAVALGVTLLILFMNSTKDIQLGSALSETDSVVSQEVATISDEAVEPEVGSTVDATEDNGNPELRTLAGGVTEIKPTAESNLIDGVTAPKNDPSLLTESSEPEARILFNFLDLEGLTTISSSRLFSPIICQS